MDRPFSGRGRGPGGRASGRYQPAARASSPRESLFRGIAAVKVNGKPVKTFQGETIELARPSGRLPIEVSYE